MKFVDVDVPLVSEQAQSISFDKRNAFLGLGTLTVYLLAYFFHLFLAVLLKLIMMISGEKFITKEKFDEFVRGLFFEKILTLTFEAYVDILINVFLNIYTLDFSTNGEILGFMILIIGSFLTMNFLPISLVWAIFSKDENQVG